MNTKEKFSYMAFGAALMFIGMLLTLMSPLTAEKDRFGEIECTKLTVVNAVGTPLVILDAGTISEHGGLVAVYGKDGYSGAGASLIISEHGGEAFTMDKYGEGKLLD